MPDPKVFIRLPKYLQELCSILLLPANPRRAFRELTFKTTERLLPLFYDRIQPNKFYLLLLEIAARAFYFVAEHSIAQEC